MLTNAFKTIKLNGGFVTKKHLCIHRSYKWSVIIRINLNFGYSFHFDCFYFVSNNSVYLIKCQALDDLHNLKIKFYKICPDFLSLQEMIKQNITKQISRVTMHDEF